MGHGIAASVFVCHHQSPVSYWDHLSPHERTPALCAPLCSFVLFGAAHVPARCASSALPQQNNITKTLGAHFSL
jgi:hypothetical protein